MWCEISRIITDERNQRKYLENKIHVDGKFYII